MKKHSLGWSTGTIYEHGDGTASFRRPGKLLDDFRVRIADVTSFSETKGGKKSLENTIHVYGRGGEICSASVNVGNTIAIERWFRAHPDFSKAAQPIEATGGGASVADELAKLASLRDSGVLSNAEFDAAKKRLLGL